MSLSIADQVVEQLSVMPRALQEQVLQFARRLGQFRPEGTPGRNLLKFAGSMSADDLVLMERAINDDCGQVDLSEW